MSSKPTCAISSESPQREGRESLQRKGGERRILPTWNSCLKL